MERLSRIRDLQRTIGQIEQQFIGTYGLNLNEALLLDSLSAGQRTSGELGSALGLSPSNTSKVIRTVEARGFVYRLIGSSDRRQMYFTLTEAGQRLLDEIDSGKLDLPDSIHRLIDQN